ncbi:MAG: hypothetical protein WBF38_00865 [Nitrosotalea sp.]
MSVTKKVDVIGQMILGAIPTFITQLYAFYKIKKLKKGVLVELAVIGLILSEYAIDYGVHLILNQGKLSSHDQDFRLVEDVMGILVASLLPMYFARKWTMEYNEKVISSTG